MDSQKETATPNLLESNVRCEHNYYIEKYLTRTELQLRCNICQKILIVNERDVS